jgi:uncharacterized protein YciI
MSDKKATFIVMRPRGPAWDETKDVREQALWDEHAQFMDDLFDRGFVFMAGPVVEERSALLIIEAADEQEVREVLQQDPWAIANILPVGSIREWQVFLDRRTKK